MNQISDAIKPLLRIRANAAENVKGIVSCEATVEVVDHLGVSMAGSELALIGIKQDFIAQHIESQLTKMHEVLRSKGHKLAVDWA